MTTMRLYAEKMTPYIVTDEDLLWFLRAVEAEGPVETEVAAVLINYFCWSRAQLGNKWSFTDAIRAYAQPVNPKWYYDGSEYLKDIQGKDPATVRELANRAIQRERVESTRTEFSLVTQKAVVAALSGLVDIPTNAVDYAAPYLDASKRKYKALQPAVPGRNRLWVRPNALTWTGYSVEPDVSSAYLQYQRVADLRDAFDRDFNAELSKIAAFFDENQKGYTNQYRQISLGKIRLNVGAAADYNSDYTVALAQKAMNQRLDGFQRAQKMVKKRAEFYTDSTAFTEANASRWKQQTASLVRMASSTTVSQPVVNAVGFDFTTGAWVTSDA